MNYNKILEELHIEAINKKEYAKNLNSQTLKNIETIAQKSFNQKGVFTVLVTLGIYKIVHPKQDIRNHQTQTKGSYTF